MTVSFWIWEALWGLVDWESLHDELNRRGRRTLCQESSAEPLMAGGAWCWWEGWLQSFLVAPPLTDCFCWKVSMHWHDSFLFCSDAKEPEDSRTIQGVSLCFQSWKGRYQDQWFSYIFSGAMRSLFIYSFIFRMQSYVNTQYMKEKKSEAAGCSLVGDFGAFWDLFSEWLLGNLLKCRVQMENYRSVWNSPSYSWA